jgi:acyl carrier protein
MLDKEDALRLVYACLTDVNSSRKPEVHLKLSPETKLLTEDGGLDSLELIEIVTTLEKRLALHLGRDVVLLDDEIIVHDPPPLADVASLANYAAARTNQ